MPVSRGLRDLADFADIYSLVAPPEMPSTSARSVGFGDAVDIEQSRPQSLVFAGLEADGAEVGVDAAVLLLQVMEDQRHRFIGNELVTEVLPGSRSL